jgi:hypothetical protein
LTRWVLILILIIVACPMSVMALEDTNEWDQQAEAGGTITLRRANPYRRAKQRSSRPAVGQHDDWDYDGFIDWRDCEL